MSIRQHIPLQARIEGGKLTIHSDQKSSISQFDAEVYVSAKHDVFTRFIWVEASAQRLCERIDNGEGGLSRNRTLICSGKLHQSNDLRQQALLLAGWGDCCEILNVNILSADDNPIKPASPKPGFANLDVNTALIWNCNIVLNNKIFDAILHAFQQDLIKSIIIGLDLNLWISEDDKNNVWVRKYYLVPHERQSLEFPDTAHGRIILIRFEHRVGLHQEIIENNHGDIFLKNLLKMQEINEDIIKMVDKLTIIQINFVKLLKLIRTVIVLLILTMFGIISKTI